MPNVYPPDELDYSYFESLARGKFFEDYTPINLPGRRYENIKISNDRTIIKLIDKTQGDLVSCICGRMMTYHGREYFEIQWTSSRIQGAGYLTYLFELIIYELGLNIMSDSNHTSPGSKEFWQSLISKSKFDIYRYDLASNYKRNASSFEADAIWGLTNAEKEEMDAKLQYFESLGFNEGLINQELYSVEDEINMSDEGLITELLDQYNQPIVEVNPLVNKFEMFRIEYRAKIKSKENIRLIAQKAK